MQDLKARYDLVVVGASFAGLVAARTAAMRGLRVAVLETKAHAGARVATTGILVKEAAEAVDIPHHLTRRVHGVRLYAPNLSAIDLFAAGSYFLTTDTSRLLSWLAAEAQRAGAAILYRTPFLGARALRDGGFELDGINLSARYILGADGARSSVAKHFGLGRNTRFITGLEHEVRGAQFDERFLHCFLDRRYARGYLGWVVPAPGFTQVGLAAGPGAKPRMELFQRSIERVVGVRDVEIVERRAGRIPCGGLVRPFARPGVLLVGDAAGMVSPLTGGGIRLAFELGRRGALAIADHLQTYGPPPEVALAPHLPSFRFKVLLRKAFDRVPSNPLLDALIGTAPLRAIAQHLYFHRRGRGGSLTFEEFEARLRSTAGEGAAQPTVTVSPGAKA